MERFFTPPSSPSNNTSNSLNNINFNSISSNNNSPSNSNSNSNSPRRIHSPRRKSNIDSTIENWVSLSSKIDDIITIEEAQNDISDSIITTLRTELLKELDKTSWMYNDYSYT